MWVADMDFRPPETVIKAVMERAAHGVYGGMKKKPCSFTDAVLNWYQTRQGWEIDPAWLIHTPGVVAGLTLSVLALTEPGEPVVIQPPVYPPFYGVLKSNGRTVVENPLVEVDGKYVMNVGELEDIFRSGVKTMLLCSPHNPVGRVWSRAELEKLGELVLRYGVTVINDEIWSDLVFPGAKHIPFATPLSGDRPADPDVQCAKQDVQHRRPPHLQRDHPQQGVPGEDLRLHGTPAHVLCQFLRDGGGRSGIHHRVPVAGLPP